MPQERVKQLQPLWLLLLAWIALRLIAVAGVNLGKDEAAYWYWNSTHLDFSYAFVPIAAIGIGKGVFCGELGDRALFLLAGAISVLLLYWLCRDCGLDLVQTRFACAAFAYSHWIWHTSSFLHPDGFLVPCWLAGLLLTRRALIRDGLLNWTLAGIVAGLAALSKYSGLALGAGIVAVLAIDIPADRGRRLLAFGLPLVAVISPLLWSQWQMQFLLPQSLGSLSQVAVEQSVVWRTLLWLSSPLLYISPLLLVVLYGAVPGALVRVIQGIRQGRARPRSELQHLVLVVPGLFVLVVFGGYALWRGQVKGNWILPAFLGLWPLAFQLLRERWRIGLFRPGIVVGAGLLHLAVPAVGLAAPGLGDALVSRLPSVINVSYTDLVSPQDLPKEPTFSWLERACEYHGWKEFGAAVDSVLSTRGWEVSSVASEQYAVAFGVTRYSKLARSVVLGDARFAHFASLGEPRPEQLLLVRRGGVDDVTSIGDYRRMEEFTLERSAVGCSPLTYEFAILERSP
ncbi:MAG: glycosyltransferase family 39 protein [Candidatus Latescibacterota bacterium]|nr:glycosyltransferase family 39 protein [Candidatus Latescibacterota bacterium]